MIRIGAHHRDSRFFPQWRFAAIGEAVETARKPTLSLLFPSRQIE
jgi:hypothetical protein